MRDWLGKPLLLLAVILLVLGVISIWWLNSGPESAGAYDKEMPTNAHHRHVRQVIEDVENGR